MPTPGKSRIGPQQPPRLVLLCHAAQGGAIVFRKRRRPTPHFKVPNPFNPIQGENANLRQDGFSPFCAMMQVMEEDTYDNFVICRGFDTRILRYMDNISVAKPFGKRKPGKYKVGEIYPAFLPTQGNVEFMDFRNVTYIPPSPSSVQWRLGQNPGVVSGGLDGGQPENLSEKVGILYDNKGKVINWLLIDSKGEEGSGGGDSIRFVIEDCICEGAELQYVLVRWTHYTGGCKDPPGVDEYSGLIKVYDTCVLEYFTIDFLLSGEATGRATYFYPRDECDTGMWLVDSICGTPECQ